MSKLDATVVKNGRTFTHQGAAVRSIHPGQPGWYFEARMKASQKVMSSTFWLITKDTLENQAVAPCPHDVNAPAPFTRMTHRHSIFIAFGERNAIMTNSHEKKLVLDIQECVGLVSDRAEAWAKGWDRIFHSNLIHRANRNSPTPVQLQHSIKTETRNSERFYVYGAWWKSPKEVRFYLDGKYAYSIRPEVAWDVPAYIQLVTETYSWNPIPADGGLVESGTWEQRTTQYAEHF